jgi:hypothetical protein
MVTLRCTERLRKRLKLPELGDSPAPTTVLGDWFGHPVSTRHARVILLVNERSRLPVLLWARRFDAFERRLLRDVFNLLLAIGVPAEAVEREVEEMADLCFARTNNRSVLGTINDYALAVRIALTSQPDTVLPDLALELSETPCGPLGYERPRDRALKLLAG